MIEAPTSALKLNPIDVVQTAMPYPKAMVQINDQTLWVGSQSYQGGLERWHWSPEGQLVSDTVIESGRIRGLAPNGNGFLATVKDSVIEANLKSYDIDGNLLETWSLEGQVTNPCNLIVQGEELWIVDCTLWDSKQAFVSNCVRRCNRQGQLIENWGGNGTAPGLFNLPIGICSDGQGGAWVADSYNHRLQQWKNGQFLKSLGEIGSLPYQLNTPQGVVQDSAGRIWIADTMNNRVLGWDAIGNPLCSYGQRGDGLENLCLPCAVLCIGHHLLVADTMNSRIVILEIVEHGNS